MFKGVLTAIVTPFREDQSIDETRLVELIEFGIKNGIQGLVPVGTTGESPTLSSAEHKKVIEITVDAVKKRVPILAGAGSNSTEEAIEYTRHAAKVGVDGTLHVTGYYNKPSQEGLYQHFKAVAEASKLPVIVYNIFSRTNVNVETPTMVRLSRIKNILGVKEASGSLDQVSAVRRECGPDFLILSGDDSLTLPILSVGGNGVISVLSNLLPDLVREMVEKYQEGDHAGALKIHLKILPMVKALFVETNPVPVKTALQISGLCSSRVRQPLVEPSKENREIIAKELKKFTIKR